MSVLLAVGSVAVAEYALGDALPTVLSPRPHLHPVRTLAGAVVTELRPADHEHHLGVSVAVADVAGATFWGGRTYVRDHGPTLLDNHGTQRHDGFEEVRPDRLVERVSWLDRDGETLLRERRVVTTEALDGGWVLGMDVRLENATGRMLSIGSPATNGRPGAGYGGVFWRAPQQATDRVVLAGEERDELRVHGSRSPWLAFSARVDRRPVSLVLVQGGCRPWFVRVADYPGFGPALAWDALLPLPPGGAVGERLDVAVLDGTVDAATAARISAAVLARR